MENNIIVLVFEEDKPINIDDISFQYSKAENMLENVKMWQEQGLYQLEDAVIAICGAGGIVKIKQTQSDTGKFALRGSGIGLLAGLLLGGPIGGLIAGTAVGAITGKMKDIGIDDKFIKQITTGLRQDTSALFLMGKAIDQEKMEEEIRPFKALVVSTTLPEEREKRLQELLKREE